PSQRYADAVTATYRPLCEFRIEGLRTTIPFLQNLLLQPDVAANQISTRYLDDNLATLLAPDGAAHPRLYVEQPAAAPATATRSGQPIVVGRAGARVDTVDPLAVLAFGRENGDAPTLPAVSDGAEGPEGTVSVRAPMQATVVSVDVQAGERVRAGQQLLVLNAMKMEHVVLAEVAGVVRQIAIAPGETLFEGELLLLIEQRDDAGDADAAATAVDLDA